MKMLKLSLLLSSLSRHCYRLEYEKSKKKKVDTRKAVFPCVTRVDTSTRSIDSMISEDGGDSPPTVAVHRWVVAVRRRGGEEKEVECGGGSGGECSGGSGLDR